jgi:hypothetical protein
MKRTRTYNIYFTKFADQYFMVYNNNTYNIPYIDDQSFNSMQSCGIEYEYDFVEVNADVYLIAENIRLDFHDCHQVTLINS